MNLILSFPGLLCPTLLADVFLLGFFYVLTRNVLNLISLVREQLRLSSLIPTPKRSLIYGHVHTLSRDQAGLYKRVDLIKDYPVMYCEYLGPFLRSITTHHPDLTKLLLNSDAHKGMLLKKLLKKSMGNGLLSSEGEYWRKKRHMLTPAFHFEILKSHVQVFNETIHTTLKWLEKKSQSTDPCDIHAACGRLSFDNMTQCVMSQHGATSKDDIGRLIQNFKILQNLAISRFTNPFLHNDFIYYNFSSEGRKAKKGMIEIDDAVNEIIRSRKKFLASDGTASKSEDSFETDSTTHFKKRKGKHIDFLDILLQSRDEDGKGLSEKEIRDEVRLFFVAGSETTGNAMTWLAYMMAQNQDWQEKCRDEINSVCENKTTIEWEDISKLKILHMCIKETLRLFPIASFLGREVMTPITFTDPNDKTKTITFKKGTYIIICNFALHRHPDFWENPHVFDPERFSPEKSKDRPAYAFLPFSAGPKNCIGQNFAMHEIKVSFAHILRKYRLLPAPELPPPVMYPSITLQPEGSVYVRVEKV